MYFDASEKKKMRRGSDGQEFPFGGGTSMVCVCVRACVRVCVRACVRACACRWVRALACVSKADDARAHTPIHVHRGVPQLTSKDAAAHTRRKGEERSSRRIQWPSADYCLNQKKSDIRLLASSLPLSVLL